MARFKAPKFKYFASIEDFVEPLGQMPVKKNSIFLYLKNKGPHFSLVLYYDEKENAVYPFGVPKSILKRIPTEKIDINIRKMFEQKKVNLDKGIYLEEGNIEDFLPKDPAERAKYIADKINQFRAFNVKK